MTRLLTCLLFLSLAGFVFPAVFAHGNDKDDPTTWTPVKIEGDQPAPEFEDITTWVNSKPLTMKGLKGKVVVVHFMAFG